MITSRTVYSYKGKDYISKIGAMSAVDDDIGELISKFLNRVPIFTAGQLRHVHDMLVNNRKEFINLLSIEPPEED